LLFDALLEDLRVHTPGTRLYALLKEVAREEIEKRFSSTEPAAGDMGRLGRIFLPYYRMGAVNSLDLFGLDELIILLFYWCNRSRYRRMVDVGANLGLHTIVMARCGFEVAAFEPDPRHFAVLERNLALNGVAGVDLHNTAVSVEAGETTFVRVLGNTTGSHLLGAKQSYGDREYFTVKTEPIKPLFRWADFIKIDAEGHERALLLATDADDWKGTDAIVEVGSEVNACVIFEHLSRFGVGMFAQRKGWQRVEQVADMPTSHRQGSLFITRADRMPWPSAH
jgi:FkbM family methyltransferase